MPFKIRPNPTYAERIKAGDVKQWRRPKWVSFLLFCCYLLTCLAVSLIYLVRYGFIYFRIDPDFLRYKDAFGFWNLTGNWMKALEGIYYRRIPLLSPSLEIGFSRGNISARHFHGKSFDVGTEYVYQAAAQGIRDYPGLWRHTYSDLLVNMANKAEAFQTICLVHVVDHIDDFSSCLKELNRSLMPGGTLHFSGFSEHLYRPSLIARLLGIVRKSWAEDFTRMLNEQRKVWHCYPPEVWRDVLGKHGFEMRAFSYIGSQGLYPYLRYFNHYVLFHNGCFDLSFYKHGFWEKIFRPIFLCFFVVIGYPPYRRMMKNKHRWGTDFYIAAVKR